MSDGVKFCGEGFPEWACGPGTECVNGKSCSVSSSIGSNNNDNNNNICADGYLNDFTMSMYRNCALPEQGLRAVYWLTGFMAVWAGYWALIEVGHARSQARLLLIMGSCINALVPLFLIAHSAQGGHGLASGVFLAFICGLLGFLLVPIMVYSLTKPIFSVERRDTSWHKKKVFGGFGISFTFLGILSWVLSAVNQHDPVVYRNVQLAFTALFGAVVAAVGWTVNKSVEHLVATITLVQRRAPKSTAGTDPITAYMERATTLRYFVGMYCVILIILTILSVILPLIFGSLPFQWAFFGAFAVSIPAFTVITTAYARNLNRYDSEELKTVRNMLADLNQGSSHESGSRRERNNSSYSGSIRGDGSWHGGRSNRTNPGSVRFSYKPKPAGRKDDVEVRVEELEEKAEEGFAYTNPSPRNTMEPVKEDDEMP